MLRKFEEGGNCYWQIAFVPGVYMQAESSKVEKLMIVLRLLIVQNLINCVRVGTLLATKYLLQSKHTAFSVTQKGLLEYPFHSLLRAATQTILQRRV